MRSCTGAQPRPTARTRTCRVCAKIVVGQLALIIHFKMAHMDARPFECRVLCARQFWTVHSRTNHERTCHGRTGTDQSPAIGSACRLCDEKCASMEELRRHFVDAHNDQRPFICTKCKRKCGTHSETIITISLKTRFVPTNACLRTRHAARVHRRHRRVMCARVVYATWNV